MITEQMDCCYWVPEADFVEAVGMVEDSHRVAELDRGPCMAGELNCKFRLELNRRVPVFPPGCWIPPGCWTAVP